MCICAHLNQRVLKCIWGDFFPPWWSWGRAVLLPGSELLHALLGGGWGGKDKGPLKVCLQWDFVQTWRVSASPPTPFSRLNVSILVILGIWSPCEHYTQVPLKCFPGGSDNKESTCNAEDPGSILGSGRSPGEGNSYPLWYSCLENSMDRGAWLAIVHRVAKSQTLLSN